MWLIKKFQLKTFGLSEFSALPFFLIGDIQVITCSSIFDTPPESLIIGPLVPLPTE
jgi:spore germination protein PD